MIPINVGLDISEFDEKTFVNLLPRFFFKKTFNTVLTIKAFMVLSSTLQDSERIWDQNSIGLSQTNAQSSS